MDRKQCWEIKQCGCEPSGKNVAELGVCPAALPNDYAGVNKGVCAGRFCWAVTGTLCDGHPPHGSYEDKLESCLTCEVLQKVNDEESGHFILLPPEV